MIAFQRNTRWTNADATVDILIVHVFHDQDKLAFYDLANPKTSRKRGDLPKERPTKEANRNRIQSLPSEMSMESLESIIAQENCVMSRPIFRTDVAAPKTLPVEKRETYLRKQTSLSSVDWSLIAPIVDDPDALETFLYGQSRGMTITERAHDTAVNPMKIQRCLANYFSRGCSRLSLARDYRACGSNYQAVLANNESQAKRGRRAEGTVYCNVNQTHREQIRQHLQKVGNRVLKQRSFKKLYESYDLHYQTAKITLINDDDETKRVVTVALPQNQRISPGSYAYHAQKIIGDREFLIAEEGEAGFDNNHAPRMGRARDDVPFPSFRYEIDATVLDCYLLLPFHKQLELVSGRPVLYLVRDVYSSMIVGFHLAFDGPNWEGALQAIYNAFTDKQEFCQEFGVEIGDSEWPCAVVCNEFTIDNGMEWPSEQVADLLRAGLGIDAANYTKIHFGRGKGGVEGEFSHVLNLIKFTVGYVEKRPKKSDKHASTAAAYTYTDLVKLMISFILMRNNATFNKSLHDQHMSEEGVEATPISVWNYGLEHYADNGRGKEAGKRDLVFTLLPKATASTCAKGFYFQGLYYFSDYGRQQGWFSDRKQRPVKHVEIRYLKSSNASIWFEHEGEIHKASLSMSHSSIYEGYTFEETENRQYFYKREEEYFDEVLHEKRLEHEQKRREITSEALARILVNSRRLQVKMADKVAKQIAAQATKNALMKNLTAHLEASATISTPVDAQLAGQATAHNEQLMYG